MFARSGHNQPLRYTIDYSSSLLHRATRESRREFSVARKLAWKLPAAVRLVVGLCSSVRGLGAVSVVQQGDDPGVRTPLLVRRSKPTAATVWPPIDCWRRAGIGNGRSPRAASAARWMRGTSTKWSARGSPSAAKSQRQGLAASGRRLANDRDPSPATNHG
jgi:hypothetical protein